MLHAWPATSTTDRSNKESKSNGGAVWREQGSITLDDQTVVDKPRVAGTSPSLLTSLAATTLWHQRGSNMQCRSSLFFPVVEISSKVMVRWKWQPPFLDKAAPKFPAPSFPCFKAATLHTEKTLWQHQLSSPSSRSTLSVFAVSDSSEAAVSNTPRARVGDEGSSSESNTL